MCKKQAMLKTIAVKALKRILRVIRSNQVQDEPAHTDVRLIIGDIEQGSV